MSTLPSTVSGLSASVPWPDMPASQWIVTVWGDMFWLGSVTAAHLCPGAWWLICDLACPWQVWKQSL